MKFGIQITMESQDIPIPRDIFQNEMLEPFKTSDFRFNLNIVVSVFGLYDPWKFAPLNNSAIMFPIQSRPGKVRDFFAVPKRTIVR